MSLSQDVLKDWAVLIVDDDPKSLHIASLLLKHYGATVHTATNGQEGLTQAQATNPNFIISDLSMPVMDGWAMIAALKQDNRTATIPVIALTAHAMVGDRERAIAAGCHNYLTKPLTPANFMADLVQLLLDIPDLAIRLNV